MMRIMLGAAAVIAVMSFDPPAARAYEFPWCAVSSMGRSGAIWDCRYRTLEECVPYVIAGNRGFCNENPRFVGPSIPARKAKRAHRRRHES